MIYTSYFAKMKAIQMADKTAVFCAVCGRLPDWFDGSWYRKAAPKLSWWKWWHDVYAGHYESEEAKNYYTACYKNTVLDKLCKSTVIEELRDIADGNNLYLLCFETPEKFCHRHLLADWLNTALDEKIIEWSEDENKN